MKVHVHLRAPHPSPSALPAHNRQLDVVAACTSLVVFYNNGGTPVSWTNTTVTSSGRTFAVWAADLVSPGTRAGRSSRVATSSFPALGLLPGTMRLE